MKKLFTLLLIFSLLASGFILSSYAEAQSSACLSMTVSTHIGSTDLSSGGQVSQLQNYLVANNYLVMPYGVSTGYFGSLTQRAVISFQAANSISPAVGFVGPITRAKIAQLTCTSTTVYPPSSNPPPSSTPPAGHSPHINSLSPDNDKTGSTVTIHGLGFTDSGNKVNFSGVSNFNLDNLSSPSDNGTILVFTVPDGDDYQCLHSHPSCSRAQRQTQPGEHTVSVSNANGTSNSVSFFVSEPCTRTDNCGAPPENDSPSISSLSPNSGSSGTTVTIHGTNLTLPAYIHFGGEVSASNGSNDGTTLVTTVPGDIGTGEKDVYVVNSHGESNHMTFTIPFR